MIREGSLEERVQLSSKEWIPVDMWMGKSGEEVRGQWKRNEIGSEHSK